MLLKILEGKKTYIGIAIALLGVFGLGNIISEGEANELVSKIIEVVGLVLAVYGRVVAKPK